MPLSRQLRAALAEYLLGKAMALDPTEDEDVLRAYRDLWTAKVAEIMREVQA